MTKHLATLLFLTSAVFAQSRFDGTWEIKMDTLQFSGPPGRIPDCPWYVSLPELRPKS